MNTQEQANESKRCAWLTDPRLPIGFNSREELKEFIYDYKEHSLKSSRDELLDQVEIAKWRIELIEEVMTERGIDFSD